MKIELTIDKSGVIWLGSYRPAIGFLHENRAESDGAVQRLKFMVKTHQDLLDALKGISKYGEMCAGTDAQRMKYLADEAIKANALAEREVNS